MADIPTSIPDKIRAGATLTFKVSFADYSAASGWAVTYSFRSALGGFNFTSTASASSHLVSVPFADTAQWLAGDYVGVGIVSDGVVKVEVWSGGLTVLPNIASAEQGADLRTQAKRTLDNINAVIEGRATSSILESTVEGTQLRRIPTADLILLADRYTAIVQSEQRAIDAANGKSTKRAIFTRFSNPQ